MKQLILFVCSAFILLQANAQDQKRSLFVTASGGAKVANQNETNKSSNVQISTSLNYLLNSKWAIGLVAAHARGITKVGQMSVPVNGGTGYSTIYNSFETKQRSWFVGPQARYYYPLTDRLSLFGEAQAGLKFESFSRESSSSSNYTGGYYYDPNGNQVYKSYSTNESEMLSLQVMASPGIVYSLTQKLGIELKTNLLQYNHDLDNSSMPDGAGQAKSFSADFSLANSRIGIGYYF